MTITTPEPIYAAHPTCSLCTWTWLHDRFWLKYPSRMCPDHGRRT